MGRVGGGSVSAYAAVPLERHFRRLDLCRWHLYIYRKKRKKSAREGEGESARSHPTLGVAPALENKASTTAVSQAADGCPDEVGHGLEEALVLPRVPKNGEEVLLRGGNRAVFEGDEEQTRGRRREKEGEGAFVLRL